MEEKLVSFETAKIAKEKGFTLFNQETKCAIVDTRNYKIQRFSFYIDTTNQDFSKLYDNVIKREITLKEDIGTNSSEINGLISYYESNVCANIHYYLSPTQSLCQKWLREVHNIDVFVIPKERITKEKIYCCHIKSNNKYINDKNEMIFNSQSFIYEESLEGGLLKALRIIPKIVKP